MNADQHLVFISVDRRSSAAKVFPLPPPATTAPAPAPAATDDHAERRSVGIGVIVTGVVTWIVSRIRSVVRARSRRPSHNRGLHGRPVIFVRANNTSSLSFGAPPVPLFRRRGSCISAGRPRSIREPPAAAPPAPIAAPGPQSAAPIAAPTPVVATPPTSLRLVPPLRWNNCVARSPECRLPDVPSAAGRGWCPRVRLSWFGHRPVQLSRWPHRHYHDGLRQVALKSSSGYGRSKRLVHRMVGKVPGNRYRCRQSVMRTAAGGRCCS
jgi:hypothetical protein